MTKISLSLSIFLAGRVAPVAPARNVVLSPAPIQMELIQIQPALEPAAPAVALALESADLAQEKREGLKRAEERLAALGRQFASNLKADDASVKAPEDAVSSEFYEAARKRGLAEPLTGLGDARLKDPSGLVAQNWVRKDHDEGISIYTYSVGGRPVQLFAVAADGRAAIITLNPRDGRLFREKIIRDKDGAVRRIVDEAAELGLSAEPAWIFPH